MSERFFVVHLQKTAGTTLFRRLRHHFGPDAVYPTPEHQRHPESVLDVDYLREAYAREGERWRVVTGHFPLCTVELLGGEFTTMTVLREPVERTLSFLRHQRRLDPEVADAPLDDIYSQPRLLHQLIHNHMVKMLGLRVADMRHGMMTFVEFDESMLERAQRNLDGIDVVGLQERLDDLLDDLEARYGWDLGKRERTNTTEAALDPPSEMLLWRIGRDNDLDIRLYEHGRRLVEARAGAG